MEEESKNMKENYLQITGKSYIDEPLKRGGNYSVAFKNIEIYGMDERGGEEAKQTFKGSSLGEVAIVNEEVFIAGKPRQGSQSQKLRAVLKELYDQQISGSDEYKDFEDYYQKRMSEIIEVETSKLL